MKYIQENWEMFPDIGLDNNFFIWLHKQASKAKINNYIQIKFLCIEKESIRNKKATMKWEKILESHQLDKGLISKLYKKLLQLNTKKINLKWAKGLNRHFTKEDN